MALEGGPMSCYVRPPGREGNVIPMRRREGRVAPTAETTNQALTGDLTADAMLVAGMGGSFAEAIPKPKD